MIFVGQGARNDQSGLFCLHTGHLVVNFPGSDRDVVELVESPVRIMELQVSGSHVREDTWASNAIPALSSGRVDAFEVISNRIDTLNPLILTHGHYIDCIVVGVCH